MKRNSHTEQLFEASNVSILFQDGVTCKPVKSCICEVIMIYFLVIRESKQLIPVTCKMD